MRSTLRYLTVATFCAAALPLALRAQDSQDSTVAQRRDAATILDHTFNAPIGEPVRVFLAKDVTYRAEVQGTGIQLQLRTMLSSQQQPLIEPLLNGPSASGSTLYSIKPRVDAEYSITTIGGDATQPVRIHLYAMPSKDKKKP